ncbi:unnamed protein product [Cylicocyclus nassatus]|uniref:Uncharacterized protein n=1 Tax=Cylicocyclus nassatus TaxID=53992 RepID=A0AA36DJ73_CYLNA|nr:unnamed protein product [Cylicocyclus nassatus]
MHHRKQRNATTTIINTTSPNKSPKVDAGHNTMAKLRFLKKPLCLQYMISSQCKRTNKTKAKDQSLIFALVLGVMRLFTWINCFIRNDVWDFITTPVDELERRMHKTSSISQQRLRKRLRDRPVPARYNKSRSSSWNQVSSDWQYRRAFSQPQLCYA